MKSFLSGALLMLAVMALTPAASIAVQFAAFFALAIGIKLEIEASK